MRHTYSFDGFSPGVNTSTSSHSAELSSSFLLPYSSLNIDQSKVLGSGSYGVVYEGTYNYDAVAIKCLHSNAKLSSKLVADFASECGLLSQLNHERIVRLKGACLDPGSYCLVMELLSGGTLYEYLHSSEDISWESRAQIGFDIISGLAYLHSQKILHRDLKSQNVLLSEHRRAKLCDFGFAKVKQEVSTQSSGEGHGKGTTRWMAPELFKRKAAAVYSPASDMYSFGVVLWELA
jgi:serine/threonine protein kinase